MSLELQHAFVLSLIASAALYVAWQAVRPFLAERAVSCGAGCGSCPANRNNPTAGFVGSEQLGIYPGTTNHSDPAMNISPNHQPLL